MVPYARRLIQKQNLQLNRGMSVKKPPSGGPVNPATAVILVSVPRNRGTLLKGIDKAIMIIPPPCIAAALQPAIARPRMNTGDDLAVAQIIDPTSNPIREQRKTIFISK